MYHTVQGPLRYSRRCLPTIAQPPRTEPSHEQWRAEKDEQRTECIQLLESGQVGSSLLDAYVIHTKSRNSLFDVVRIGAFFSYFLYLLVLYYVTPAPPRASQKSPLTCMSPTN